MDRIQRKGSVTGNVEPSRPSREAGPADGPLPSRASAPVQQKSEGSREGSRAGAWEADDSLMSAMGLGAAPAAVQRKRADEAPASGNMEAHAGAGISGAGGAVPYQAKMEQAFGTSFAGVSAHSGPQAAEACDAMGAQAYATGSNIAFKKSDPDESLVAHELTHVLQQRGGVQAKGAGESSSLEAEADTVGARVAAGESVADVAAKYTGGGQASGVQRKEATAEGGAAPSGEKGDPVGGAPATDRDVPATPAAGERDASAEGAAHDAPDGAAGGEAVAKPGVKPKPKGEPKRAGPASPTGEPAPAEAHAGEGGGAAPQLSRDTTWAGNYLDVTHMSGVDGADLIGNVTPGHSGKYQVGFDYHVRYLYLGDTTGGFDYGAGNVVKWGHQMSGGKHFVYSASLPHTKPGVWSAWLRNPGGVFADSMHAEENFRVVNPVTMKGKKSETTVYDFDNPIPLQMSGDSELKFKLSKAMVKSKRMGASAAGSASTSVTDKFSFGVKLAIDNDAGSEGGAEWGMSSASTQEFKRQWSAEQYSSKEISGESWMEQTYHPSAKEKGRSKMLVPTYQWVEYNAEVYPHNPATLAVTGKKTNAVFGLLIPTGKFEELRSTDPGNNSDSKPTKDAEVDPTDAGQNPAMDKSFKDHLPTAQGWQTLPGAKFAEDGHTLQFIRGPHKNDPAERDYGIQDGHRIHPGNDDESSAEGGNESITAEDGLTASSSEESSSVTTNSVSKSFEAMPGIKGLGQVGDSLKFENESGLGSSTGTGLSSSSSTKSTTSIATSFTVSKKPTQNQFVVFTPLYTHKTFEVAWGAHKPATGNQVDPETLSKGYVHTYQHTALPHVKVFDVPKNPKVKLGRYNFPDHVDV
jgi:hypothetical protein